MSFSRDSCSDAGGGAPVGVALPIDSAREWRMYHCPMPDPKVLNAVAAVNALLADPAFAERFPRDGPVAAMSLEVAA